MKLTPRSSCHDVAADPLLGRYAAIRRRCAQTAHISLLITTVSKSDHPTRKAKRARFPSDHRPPHLQIFRGVPGCLRCRPFPSPSLSCFGEGLFTDGRGIPQEEKSPPVTFSSLFRNYPQYLGLGANFTPKTPRPTQLSCPDHADVRPEACVSGPA